MSRLTACVGAAVITLAMFVLMDTMVARDRTRLLNVIDAEPIEFVRTDLEEQTQKKDRRKKPPPKPKEIKRVRSEVDASVNRAASLPQDFTAYNVSSLLGEGSGLALGQSLLEGSGAAMAMVMASDLTPLTMLPPQYPPSALMRGTEGWVQISFQVSEEGFVEDPQVIDAKPRGVFDEAAKTAALRWRFRPVLDAGVPVAVRAYMTIDFNLPES